jgi:hypothetical protein
MENLGLYVTVASAVMFRALYELTALLAYVCSYVCPNPTVQVAPVWYRELDDNGKNPLTKLKWRNILVSWFHGLFVGTAAIVAFELLPLCS